MVGGGAYPFTPLDATAVASLAAPPAWSLGFIKCLLGDVLDIDQRAPHLVKARFESPDLAAQTANLGFKIFPHGSW